MKISSWYIGRIGTVEVIAGTECVGVYVQGSQVSSTTAVFSVAPY